VIAKICLVWKKKEAFYDKIGKENRWMVKIVLDGGSCFIYLVLI